MAFQRGSQINPALGRTDFTPFLQGSLAGSQMAAQGAGAMGQGLAGLMSGVGQGIDAYKKNKEETKKLEGFLKAADKMSAGFEPIMDKIDPRIGQSIQQMRQMIGDPNLSVKERASAAQAFLQQAPVLLNSGIQFMDKQNEAAATNQRAVEAAMQMQAKQQELQRKQQEEALKRQIEVGASQYVASGGNMPQGVDQTLAPLIQVEGRKRLAEIQKAEMDAKAQAPSGYRFKANGDLEPIPNGPAAQNISVEQAKAEEARRKLAIEIGTSQWVASGGKMPQGIDPSIAPIVQAQGMKELADLQAKQASLKPSVPAGYEALPDGTLRAIPGGPAAQKLAEEKAKADEAKRMAEERAALVREGAMNTLGRAVTAYDLVAKKGAGGPWEGWFPKVSAKLGLEENRDLLSEINTIKAALTLDKIMEMRAASKTGGSPLGVASDKDVQLLGASVAELETDMTEAKLKENLQRIATLTAKIAGVDAPKLGTTSRPNTLKGGPRAPASQRYQIVQ